MRRLLLLSLLLSGCATPNPRVTTAPNDAAALTGDLPANPLSWQVITSAVNHKELTMYTLFGNEVAIKSARAGVDYPSGATVALVTWKEQEDPRWFGGRIPAAPLSVEFVNVGPTKVYSLYQGVPLKKVEGAPDRSAYLLAQRAAVMP